MTTFLEQARSLLERGAVFADTWPEPVRDLLNIEDPLVGEVVAALEERRSVILAGNAGDGKTHLAQQALGRLEDLDVVAVRRGEPAVVTDADRSIVFIKDASGLTNEAILEAVQTARRTGAPFLITINEGPLDSLAGEEPETLFADIRVLLHRRQQGDTEEDPADLRILNLAGRQLPRSQFVQHALVKLLPLVTACDICGVDDGCPRRVSADLLADSETARDRVARIVRILSDQSRHLTAREIWNFLIDLFFVWQCPAGGVEGTRSGGYFWNRIFGGGTELSDRVAQEFDPATVSSPMRDVEIWTMRGDFSVDYPGTAPSVLARADEELAIRVFASAKRFDFFFDEKAPVEDLLAHQSDATVYGQFLNDALERPNSVVRRLSGMVNRFRLAEGTEAELHIARHHSFAAHRRPAVLASMDRVPVTEMVLRIPFLHDLRRYPEAGFFPPMLLLAWKVRPAAVLSIDYTTWRLLRTERTLTVDRAQEVLDYSIDLFLSRAPLPEESPAELLTYDHRRRRRVRILLRPDDPAIEVLEAR